MIRRLLPLILLAGAALPAGAFQAEVLDHLVLDEVPVDGQGLAEISGLSFDAASGRLYGVSDRAILFTFDLTMDNDRLALTPVSATPLTGRDGAELDPKVFNPEGMTALGPQEAGQLAIISEEGAQVARFDLEGQWLDAVAMPASLGAAVQARGGKRGPESLARHPEGWLVTAPEDPMLADTGLRHDLITSNGLALSYGLPPDRPTRIKAMTVLPDGRLLILERFEDKPAKALRPDLRVIDPRTCRDGTCADSSTAPIEVPGITDADYEGLTQ
ncbi:MAG: esterase-like activity of phytase family protein, partial [Alphaproteobacteria bacterium]|nr:esterase-like activity of phytase family protein [Alphaproteobacteria bacterium]